jgi:hypothetical protein
MNTFKYIEFEQPLNVKAGESLLYDQDGTGEVRHVRSDGITVCYERLYSEEKRAYVYREVYTNSRRLP